MTQVTGFTAELADSIVFYLLLSIWYDSPTELVAMFYLLCRRNDLSPGYNPVTPTLAFISVFSLLQEAAQALA